ncbi:hypothetical protein ACJMK2_021354 [Sinanodonta woodiana]|uniref:MAM domain-containing protein n=1 Tax=Sinanodonta woodiana TaxID=1069815 RepID=A0ABD3TIB5_SINWO
MSSKKQITAARLLSTPLKQPHTCLIFWYSMYESDVQSLKVFIKANASTMVEIWNKTGNMLTVWTEARAEFSYDGEFQLMFEGRKESPGHMALDDISVTEVCPDIGNTDSKKNQLSYGVYVGTATGLAAILLIAGIVILIIVRKKRQRQESQKNETIIRREFPNANKYGDTYQEEKTNISNRNPDGKRLESIESHLNVHISTNYAYAEILDAKFDQVANAYDENTKTLPCKQTNLYDYSGADDVYNTTYESSRRIDDNAYDHISNKDDYKNITKVLNKEVFEPIYNHTTEKETHDETQATKKYAMSNQTYEVVRTHSATNSTCV